MKFDTIFESNFTRLQGGGFLTGDIIKLKSGWESCDWCKTAPDHVIDKLKEVAESDLVKRVSAVKTVRPAVNSSVDQAAGVDGFFVDITIETAPGRYTDYITVPQEIIELDGDNDKLPEIPDSLKREEDVDVKPRELESEDTGDGDKPRALNPEEDTGTDDKVNRKLTDKNKKLPGATAAKSYTANYLN